jgi:CheY-like chemotaxis protein
MYILLVEDDPGIRTMLAEFLTDEGYVVVTAADGAEALAHLAASPLLPKLILLDLMMPVMNGWTFRARQGSDPRWCDIPVVVLTASPNAAQSVAPRAAGVLGKPLDLDTLLDTIQQYASYVEVTVG